MQKFLDGLEINSDDNKAKDKVVELSEDRATLLFMIDTYSKHLIDLDQHPLRKVRSTLDQFAKELVSSDPKVLERSLFRFRQFFSSYRIAEFAYIEKTMLDFRNIIWDFVEQMSEDIKVDEAEDSIKASFVQLRNAVESNSIEDLRNSSRQFIDSYMEHQYRRDARKSEKLTSFQKNLKSVKKQLVEANESMNKDHLTKAFNRKSFDEQIMNEWKFFQVSKEPVTLLMLDIDHFKKVNDNYGHATGDAILIECVRLLQESFAFEGSFVARVGGEEFAILLHNCGVNKAAHLGNKCREKISKEVYVDGQDQIRFTISMGVAQLEAEESIDAWMKRADEALYSSKNTGRNKLTIAEHRDLEIAS